MTKEDVAAFVAQRWQDGHTVQAIRMQLTCLGVKLTDEQIKKGIKAYVDSFDENASLGGARAGR